MATLRAPCQYAFGRSLNGRGSLSQYRDRINVRRVALPPPSVAYARERTPRLTYTTTDGYYYYYYSFHRIFFFWFYRSRQTFVGRLFIQTKYLTIFNKIKVIWKRKKTFGRYFSFCVFSNRWPVLRYSAWRKRSMWLYYSIIIHVNQPEIVGLVRF